MARPMPVLPDVPSTIVPPGLSLPVRSASSIIFTAIRSLIELPGLNVSSLMRTVASVTSRVIALTRTIGVWPMASRMVSQIFCPGALATGYLYHDWLVVGSWWFVVGDLSPTTTNPLTTNHQPGEPPARLARDGDADGAP